MKFFMLVFLIAFFSFSENLFCEQTADKQMSVALSSSMVEKMPSNTDIAVDFETYQRNIDDIFQIALMKSPTVDYGLNRIIVNLNRQITEDSKDPEPLISLGHVYRIIGQPAEANRFYEKALALDPNSFHLNIFSALTSSQIEDYENALLKLDQATNLHPNESYSWVVKGRILMLLKRDQEAIESLKKAFELEPNNRQVGFALSLLYEQVGDPDHAFLILEKLKDQNPSDIFVQYHLGALSLMENNVQKALEHWNKLFSDGVRDTQFLFNLSMAYLRNNEAAKAEKILEHLQFFLPNEQDVEVMMAEGYRQMHQFEEAERRYRLVLAENPRYVTAYIGLSQVLDELGRYDERDEILKEASFYAEEEQKKAVSKLKMRDFRSQVFGDPDFDVPESGFSKQS
jgi:tetratricopeptide (TPR) repeat protein